MSNPLDLLIGLTILLVVNVFLVGMACLTSTWALLRKFNPRWVVLLGTLTVLLLTLAIFSLSLIGQKQDLWALVRDYFSQKQFDENWRLFTQGMESLGSAQMGKLETFKEIYKNYLYWALPAWVMIRCLVEGLLAYYITSAMFSRITAKVPKAIAFREWMVPEPLVFGLIVGGFIKFFLAKLVWVEILGGNILIFFFGVYLLAGLSIVSFFFGKWKIHPFFRVLMYPMLLAFAYDSIFCLGVLDVWFDFRKVKTPPPAPAS